MTKYVVGRGEPFLTLLESNRPADYCTFSRAGARRNSGVTCIITGGEVGGSSLA